MTDTLRDWADTCEARALDALDTSPALAPNVLLEVAMLLDQRADYLEQRGHTGTAAMEAAQRGLRELLEIIEKVDTACREQIEAATLPESDAIALFARHIRDLTTVHRARGVPL